MQTREMWWQQKITPYLLCARDLAHVLQVAVVCSTRGETEPRDDYERQSIESRFYSSAETEHFLGALRRVGFLVNPFFSEQDFMRWIDGKGHLEASPRKLLVISTGASFPGVGSKSLIPAFCRLHGLEVAGPDPHSASLARHKYHATLIMRTLGDVAPRCWCYHPNYGWLNDQEPPRGLPVIIKLNHEGASIGIDNSSVIAADKELTERVSDTAQDYAQAVLVQEFISGYEVEVPLFCIPRPRALMPVGISLEREQLLGDRILSYDISQADAYDFWDFGSTRSATQISTILSLAEACAEVLCLRDLARIDFRVDSSGAAKAIDVSTSPYISPHSSFAFVAEASGASATELPVLLVGLAAVRLGLCLLDPSA